MRRLLVIALALCSSTLRADSPALTISQQLIASPAPVFAPTSTSLLLTWLEPGAGGTLRPFVSTWETASTRWSAPRPRTSSDSHAAPLAASSTPHVRFLDDSELTVFFPEKDGRILDLHTRRRRAKTSAAPTALSADSWLKAPLAFHLEPPLLRAREARVIAVWINHAEKSARLFAALSTNAGEQFFLPVRIDDGRPLGRASLVLLRDGSAYISWIEAHASAHAALWLRRLSPSGDPSVPVLIASAPSATAFGHPQLALLKEDDATPAQLLLAHELTTDGVTQLVTRLITLPPATSFTQGRPCLTCPPDEATKPGHTLRGNIVKIIPRKQQVIVRHDALPGIMRAGQHTFRTDEKTRDALQKSSTILGRIEQRDGVWWLFDVRTIHRTP